MAGAAFLDLLKSSRSSRAHYLLELFANDGPWTKVNSRMQFFLFPNQYVRLLSFAHLIARMQLHTLLFSLFPKPREPVELISRGLLSPTASGLLPIRIDYRLVLIDFCKYLQKSRTPFGAINQLGVG